jgi:hypothetical protein
VNPLNPNQFSPLGIKGDEKSNESNGPTGSSQGTCAKSLAMTGYITFLSFLTLYYTEFSQSGCFRINFEY